MSVPVNDVLLLTEYVLTVCLRQPIEKLVKWSLKPRLSRDIRMPMKRKTSTLRGAKYK